MSDAVKDEGVLTEFPATITFDRHEDIRAALFDPNLSRSFAHTRTATSAAAS